MALGIVTLINRRVSESAESLRRRGFGRFPELPATGQPKGKESGNTYHRNRDCLRYDIRERSVQKMSNPIQVTTNKRAYTLLDPGPGKPKVEWLPGEKVIEIIPVESDTETE